MYDYRAPVTAWPHWVRVRWPNTIATLVLLGACFAPAPADRTARYRRMPPPVWASR